MSDVIHDGLLTHIRDACSCEDTVEDVEFIPITSKLLCIRQLRVATGKGSYYVDNARSVLLSESCVNVLNQLYERIFVVIITWVCMSGKSKGGPIY